MHALPHNNVAHTEDDTLCALFFLLRAGPIRNEEAFIFLLHGTIIIIMAMSSLPNFTVICRYKGGVARVDMFCQFALLHTPCHALSLSRPIIIHQRHPKTPPFYLHSYYYSHPILIVDHSSVVLWPHDKERERVQLISPNISSMHITFFLSVCGILPLSFGTQVSVTLTHNKTTTRIPRDRSDASFIPSFVLTQPECAPPD